MKLLIVEDEEDALEMLNVYFSAKGYEIVNALDGVEALDLFAKTDPDVVLLDVMIPRLNGWNVLEGIRAQSNTPVILITARDGTDDVIRGLTLGGDDYMTKPFEPRELEARIQAIFRRNQENQVVKEIEVGDLEINDREKKVVLKGKTLNLSPKEYDLLKLLASEPGRVFSDNEIIAELWPSSSHATANDVKQYIHLLRNKVEDDPHKPVFVVTIKGFGYKLAVD